MSSPNLGIIHIAAAQNQKEVTANTAFDDLDLALTNVVVESMQDLHFLVPMADATENMVFIFVGILTANRGVQLPARKLYVVSNQTTSSPATVLMFGSASSPSGRIAFVPQSGPGTYTVLYCDGVNVDVIATSGGNGAPTTGEYVLGVANGTLSNSAVNPTAYHGVDAAPVVPGSLDDEFEGSVLSGSWATVNPGSSSLSVSNSLFKLTQPSHASDSNASIVKATPVTPWQVDCKFRMVGSAIQSAGFMNLGLCVRDSVAGALIRFVLAQSGVASSIPQYQLQILWFNSPTSFNSTPTSLNWFPVTGDFFLRIKDDGVNLIFSYSADGSSYFQIASEARTSFLTSPSQVGITFDAGNAASGDLHGSVDWFRRSL